MQTVYPFFCRDLHEVAYQRERIETADGDFLDLDWSRSGGDRVAVVVHGLEGSSRSRTVLGMVLALNRRGWDAVAMNLRGCSGEQNRRPRTYHAGATDDLAAVLEHVSVPTGRRVALVGFSLGGNQVLKFLGEDPHRADALVSRAVAVSVPCHLSDSADVIDSPRNLPYRRHFLRKLLIKVRRLREMAPDLVPDPDVTRPNTFRAFDDAYTGPLNGFVNAADYYARVSCLQFLPMIGVPTLLLNAANDPLLAPSCFPFQEAKYHPHLTLEVPNGGGHAGFARFGRPAEYWSETRAGEFIEGASH